MSAAGGVRAGAPRTVTAQELWSADLGDRGHGLAPDAATTDGVVLGRLLGDDAHAGASAVQLQRQLGISYETAWALLHKLRRAMVNPDREALKDKEVIHLSPDIH